ncbi:MAG: polyprenyl synthetase family protein [Elusimicrobiota bacterium]|nr:MAG: polyprenyl synthetase family protein [Elusimicrobiota bacterium]
MNASLSRAMEKNTALVDQAMEKLLAPTPDLPESVRKAMRYSLFAGGKRLRPTLVLEAAECCGLSAKKALKTAAALEMIHTYSLIHDDLPAMDDDDLRRGKPTNHKVFGEAMAILAGDGLLTKAFEATAENAADLKLKGKATAELVRVVAYGAGAEGMVGGQVADLAAEGMKRKLSKAAAAKMLEGVHRRKTGALIVASLDAGAVLAATSDKNRESLRAYGACIGLAFQIADDVLDVVGDKKKLGKKGSDVANDKLTYASLYGVDGARAKARALVEMAHANLKGFGRKADVLHDLADYIIERDK